LDQYTHGIVAYTPGRGPDAPLETVAAHACPPSDRTLLDRATTSSIERGERMLSCDMEAIDIIQAAIIGLSYNRKRPQKGWIAIPLPSDHCITHNPDAVRVRNQDGPLK
tara:strand:+ start:195 stop:521 length:327 start_codon:yes stop_codon:yes gene_type:complete